MKKTEKNIANKKGISLVEIILSVAIFTLFIGAFTGIYIYGQEATVLAGNRVQATFYAKEGMEVIRNIRDENFETLTDGTHGLEKIGDTWELSGNQDTYDFFTREAEVLTINSDKKEIKITVSWQQTPQREGIVELKGHLTNWQKIVEPDPIIETCADWCVFLGYTDGICRQNPRQCERNDEIHEEGGNEFCPGPPNTDCCCF